MGSALNAAFLYYIPVKLEKMVLQEIHLIQRTVLIYPSHYFIHVPLRAGMVMPYQYVMAGVVTSSDCGE